MSLEQVTDEDVLYVRASDIRTKILQYLSGRPRDYVKSTELAKAISEKPGTVSFHCKGLKQHNLVDDQLAVGKRHIRITEKGTKVIKEVDKRQGGGRR